MKRLYPTLFVASLLLVAGCSTNDDTPTMDESEEPVIEQSMSEEMMSSEVMSDETMSDEMMSTETMTLQLLENEEVGEYLADSDGMALYYFKNDEPGKSNASGDVLESWPAFTAEEFEVPTGFDEDDFDTIEREDTGEEQVTYKEYPLYYFAKDKKNGDVNGEGVKEVWYIVNTETTFDN